MPSDILLELIELAGALRPAHEDLLERARAFGRALGIEVLDLRPAGLDGAWDLRVRVDSNSELGHSLQSSASAAHPAQSPRVGRVRPAPFHSPVRDSVPFSGDGSGDLRRFFAEADRSTRVPRRGSPESGVGIRVLSTSERVRMLASTIAGDALLSVQRQGLASDEAEVDTALANARVLYVAEVAGVDAAGMLGEDPAAYFDHVAAELRHNLLQPCS